MEGPETVDLAGMLLPFRNGRPILVQVPGSDDRFIPVFTERQDLVATMIAAHAIYDKIEPIDPNVGEFLLDLVESPIPIKLMVNPHFVDGELQYRNIDPAKLLAVEE